jgi:alkanesulfonate monooxygenase SsuD/methylene tetrahydromethanopterin reductase-like flavin-dependent oxidoreductase (luciferase family)
VRYDIYGGPGSDWNAALRWVRMEEEELGFDSYWVGDHPVEFSFRVAAVNRSRRRAQQRPLARLEPAPGSCRCS